MSLPSRPSRIDFDSIDVNQIERILRDKDVDSLSPEERSYYDMMELVRGLRARTLLPGGKRITTKAGIIKLLKSDVYGLSDWTARRVYADALNFFFAEDGITVKAWSGYYAERLEKLADIAVSVGNLKEARQFIVQAAKLRGCYSEQAPEIPRELLDAAPVVIYDTDPRAMGAPAASRPELRKFIDSIPDMPEVSRRRVKEDAGIEPVNLYRRMIEDMKEFGDDQEEK